MASFSIVKTKFTFWLMPLSIWLHYISYEAVRAVAIAMISSEAAGFHEGSGYRWVVRLNVPVSACLFYSYSFWKRFYGVQRTVRLSNFTICCILVLMGILFVNNEAALAGKFGQAANVLFHIWSQAYCSLHASYEWGFILDHYYYANGRMAPSGKGNDDYEKRNMVVVVGSLCSLASVFGSFILYQIEGQIGALLVMAVVCSLLSWGVSEWAYASLAEREAAREREERRRLAVSEKDSGEETRHLSFVAKNVRLLKECWALLSGHRTVALLLGEALGHQATSAILLHMFHEALRVLLATDDAKAYATGNLFMAVNVVACSLQMVVMPSLLSGDSMPYVLMAVPLVVLGGCLSGTLFTRQGQGQPSLVAALVPFASMKVVEYAVKISANEMVFLSLEPEARYLGKDLVRLFGIKIGKFVSQQVLALAISSYSYDYSAGAGAGAGGGGDNGAPSVSTLASWGSKAALVWFGLMFLLGSHLRVRGRGRRAGSGINSEQAEAEKAPAASATPVTRSRSRSRSRSGSRRMGDMRKRTRSKGKGKGKGKGKEAYKQS